MQVLAPIFYILVLLTSSSFCASFSASQLEQAKAMVASNPSLLNSQQAKDALNSYNRQQSTLSLDENQKMISVDNNIPPAFSSDTVKS